MYLSAHLQMRKRYFTLPVRKRGMEGVKGTVTEDFRGILVHDHEITFTVMEALIRNALRM